MKNKDQSLAVILILWITLLVHPCRTCDFPVSLQGPGDTPAWWLYHVTASGAQLMDNTIVYVEFHKGFMSTTAIGGNLVSSKPLTYSRQCVDEYDDDTYLVTHHEQNKDVCYMCMKFIQRSSQVNQISTSTNSSHPLNCTEQSLTLDPWPLIRYDDDGADVQDIIPCPFEGGYDLELYNKQSVNMCTDKYFIPRLTCGCDKTNHIVFDLQACEVANILVGIEPKQELVNIATWDDGEYRFSILKRAEVGLYWSLRLPVTKSSHMSGYVSPDVICGNDNDTNDLNNLLRLHLNVRIVDSVCADVSPYCSPSKCEEASLFSELYCEATCGLCKDLEISTCQFPASAHGSWRSLTTDEAFYIGSSSIQFDNDKRASPCIYFDTYTNTYQLMQFDENGCSPKYVCMILTSLSPAAIRYHISPGPIWDPLFGPGNCMHQRKYNQVWEELEMSLAVLNDQDSTVPCELPGAGFMVLAMSKDESTCHGRLYKQDCQAGSEADSLVLNYTRCLDEQSIMKRQFACLAQMPVFVKRRRLVLIKDKSTGAMYCLGFSLTVSNIELVPASKCRGDYDKQDTLMTLHVTQEMPTCETSKIKDDIAQAGNFTQAIVHGSFSWDDSPTEDHDLIENVKTVTPVIEADHWNAMDTDYNKIHRNYYQSNKQEMNELLSNEGTIERENELDSKTEHAVGISHNMESDSCTYHTLCLYNYVYCVIVLYVFDKLV